MARLFAIALGGGRGLRDRAWGLLAGTARAADSIYWSRETLGESIRYRPLTGENGGSTPAQTLFSDAGRPCGIALNPTARKIYWATWAGGEIRVANLNGTGTASTLLAAPGNRLCGVAVDPVARKIYWANFSTNEIRVANLNGTRAVTLFTEPAGSAPSGVTIDPANNKIYWTNQFSDEVRAGNLDGSGTPQTLFAGEDNPIGVAADPAAGKIYWTDLDSDTVRVGPLGGSTVGIPETLFNSPSPSGPAIDPTENKIYWASWTSNFGIRAGNPRRRHRDGLDPFRRRDRTGVRRAAEGASEHAAPEDLRQSQGGEGAHLRKRDVGARLARVVPVQGPLRLRLSVEEKWVEHRRRSGVHAQPDRRLHLHRQGHQPGRVDLADESQEEGQGRVGQGRRDVVVSEALEGTSEIRDGRARGSMPLYSNSLGDRPSLIRRTR